MQATNVLSMPVRYAKFNISWKSAAIMGSLFVAYLGVAELGTFLHAPTPLPIFWPPAGIALAAMVLYGFSVWPAIAFGALLFCIIHGVPFPLTVIMVVVTTLQPMLGAYLLAHLKFDPMLARVNDTVSLFTVSALISLMVPVAAASALWAIHSIELSDFFSVIGPLWLGHMLSMSILAPFVIRWMRWPYPRTKAELFEMVASVGILTFLDIVVFTTPYGRAFGIPLAYVTLLPLLWLSLRVGPRGMTLGLLITGVIALAGVIGQPVISADTLFWTYVNTEIYLTVLAILFLIFVSSEEGRKDALLSVRGYVEKLERALQQIRSEDRTKSEFIAVLAHELRNPLAAIQISAQVIGMETADNERVHPLVASIDERVKTTSRMLDDLLDISRISRQKLDLRKESVSVSDAALRAIESVQQEAANRKQTIITRAKQSCRVSADPMRFEQILVNLLTNAVKYTPEGGTITISCESDAEYAAIRIADTGIGISSQMIQKIFEPFVQVSHSTGSNSGLGIGLSLTRQLVEMHGGSIEAASGGVGRGSTFTIRIPLADAAPQAGGLFGIPWPLMHRPKTAVTALPELSEAQARILVVDDNELAAQGLCKLLGMRGFPAEAVYTGEDAMKSVLQLRPDAIILDIGLPGMSGYEVAQALRSKHGYTGAIIALTGYGQEKDRQKALEAGCDYHLVKPVGLADVEAVLNEALGATHQASAKTQNSRMR